MAAIEACKFRNEEITKKLEEMWNAEDYSDTVIHVNKSQFHVCSDLIRVSSVGFKSLLDIHFSNSGDREIRISNIKHDESFCVLLKYIYAFEMDFAQMDKSVVCEVLGLCDTYKMTSFSKQIKDYLSTLNCFQVESVVALLNTSKEFNLEELYQKLTVFAYENAEQLVKHASFVNLHYRVLIDLIKSDWFCAPEIDILMGSLGWHNENIISECPNLEIKALENEIGSETVAEEQVIGNDNDLSASVLKEMEEDSNLAEKMDTVSDDGDNKKEYSLEKDEPLVVNETSTNLNEEILNCEVVPAKTDSCAETIKIFSEKILKVLLSHVRMEQITLAQCLEAFESPLFKKHGEQLRCKRFYSQKRETRVKYGTVTSLITQPSPTIVKLENITRVFTFNCGDDFVRSGQEDTIGNLNWKISLAILDRELAYRWCTLEVRVECTPNDIEHNILCGEVKIITGYIKRIG